MARPMPVGVASVDFALGDGLKCRPRAKSARRLNREGLSACPSARSIEKVLYETYLQGRDEGSGIEEFLGIETRGRIELEYTGTYG